VLFACTEMLPPWKLLVRIYALYALYTRIYGIYGIYGGYMVAHIRLLTSLVCM
jgi:hypothetical protein